MGRRINLYCSTESSKAKLKATIAAKYDITGKRFNHLVVLGCPQRINGATYWECLCDCGKRKLIQRTHITGGGCQSCGCMRGVLAAEKNSTHLLSKTKEYSAWQSMKTRCYNEKTDYYQYWGGRGIRVCDRWLNSFENFLEDMGERPSAEYSLDRIDVNGHYEPGNCRWATDLQQRHNQRPRARKR